MALGTSGSYQTLALRLEQLGVRWLAIRAGQSHRQKAWAPDKARACVFEMHERGIQVLPWWYSVPSTTPEQLRMVEGLLKDGIDGLIINAEIEWENKSHWPLAKVFAREVKALAGDTYVAHAPFGWGPLHGAFPFDAFGEELDGVHPQLYWTELKHGRFDEMMQKAVPWWETRGGGFCPVGVSYGKGSRLAPSIPGEFKVDEFELFLQYFSTYPAVSLYSFENANPACLSTLAHYKQAADIAGIGVLNRTRLA